MGVGDLLVATKHKLGSSFRTSDLTKNRNTQVALLFSHMNELTFCSNSIINVSNFTLVLSKSKISDALSSYSNMSDYCVTI